MRWGVFWSALAAIATAAGAYPAYKALQHGPDLAATATYGPVEIPPDVQKVADAAGPLRNWALFHQSKMSAFNGPLWPDQTRNSDDLKSFLEIERAAADLPLLNANPSRGYVRVLITNRGDQRSDDIRISLPDTRSFTWTPPGDQARTKVFDGNVVTISGLSQDETTEVTAFLDYEPNYSKASEVRVADKSIKGTVSVHGVDEPKIGLGVSVGVISVVVGLISSLALFALVIYSRWMRYAVLRARVFVAALHPGNDTVHMRNK